MINNWNELSAAALEKFFKDNFDASWKKFDMYDRGSIPDTEEVYFARDLMSALAPPEKEDPYALDFSEKKVKQIEVDPLVEPDAPVIARPADHTKTKPAKSESAATPAPKAPADNKTAPASTPAPATPAPAPAATPASTTTPESTPAKTTTTAAQLEE